MKTALGVTGSLALIIGLLYCSVALTAFDLGFYEAEYDKLKVCEAIKIDKHELMSVTAHMLDYLADKEQSLQVKAVVDGISRDFFSRRELDHMVDVKNLFTVGRIIKNICFFGSAIAFGFIIAAKPSHEGCGAKGTGLGFIAVLYLWTLAGFVIAASVICLMAYLDFDRVFTIFHQIFFTNDLWLLDPETELLINIVPLNFFVDIAGRIVVVFAGFMGVTALICIFYRLYSYGFYYRR